MWNMLRQASGGDISQKNLALIEGLLDILIEHRPWLEKQTMLFRAVVYTYVRLLEDHRSPLLVNLRNKEIKFIISLIRENFIDVLPLGRDFVRFVYLKNHFFFVSFIRNFIYRFQATAKCCHDSRI